MNGPIDYSRAIIAAAGPGRELHIRGHADGSLDFIRALDGGPIPTQAEIEAAWAAMPEPGVVWSTLDFLLRFTPQERASARASTIPEVQDFLDLLRAAGEVRSDHPLTQQGMGLLVTAGLLTAERRDEILGG